MPRIALDGLACRLLPAVAPGRALADREWTTLVHLAEVLLDGCPVEIGAPQVANNVECFLIEGRSRFAWRVRVLLTLIELLPISATGRRFSALTVADRTELVRERFIDGKGPWALCAKVRLLVLMGTYGDPSAASATGFVPVPERVRFRTRARRVAPPLEAVS